MPDRDEITLKIKVATEELVEVIKFIKGLDARHVANQSKPSKGDKWVAEQICFHTSKDDIERLMERSTQTDREASDQFDDSKAQDIVLNQMVEAMKRGADPFPMMDDEGIKALKGVTDGLIERVIPVQDLIQVRDVADDLRKATKYLNHDVTNQEYKKVCYVPKEIQKVAARELHAFAHPFESSLFLVDFLLSQFYPDDKRIKIKLADGYIPQVFVIDEYDESNEGYSAELRVRDKNKEGKYEAIRGFVKPYKAINFKLFC